MLKLLLLAFVVSSLVFSLVACTHGSFASNKDLDSARFARQDLCCAATMNKINDKKYEALGCGQKATYVYANKQWSREGAIQAGSGDPADKLKDCNQ